MIIYNKSKKINELTQEELTILNKYISLLKKKKDNLLNFLNSINNSIQNMEDLDNLNNSVNLLRDIRTCIDDIRTTISQLEDLKNMLNDFTEDNDISSNYNNQFNKCSLKIYDISMKIEDFISSYLSNSTFTPLDDKKDIDVISNNNDSNTENLEVTDKDNLNSITDSEKNKVSLSENDENTDSSTTKKKKKKTKKSDNSNDDITQDNLVLLISEKQNKVFLPYTLADLESKLNKKSKYKSLREIVDAEYIVPYDKYKNSTISRFRESYNLMKNKEKASVIDSLDLALELCFNSSLNPAIITACKSLNELDIYLDYLDSDELDKFNLFKIKYELLPKKVKKESQEF